MATEFLERTAIQMFKDDSIVFQTLQDDLVRIRLPIDGAGMVDFEILDHENGALTIRVQDFVRFPAEQGIYSSEVCNELNTKTYGKFLVDEYRDVSYHLDLPVAETAGPSEFRPAMIFAVSSFAKYYPIIMTVRWANATVEQALERQEGGKPGTPLISDDQIRRILYGSDSEKDDTE